MTLNALSLSNTCLNSEASFSSCGLYRWYLKRTLSSKSRTIVFIGLNPSKASSLKDDATLNRLLGFSRRWGYGIIVVVNLFARISHSPDILKRCSDPVGEENDHELSVHASIWSQNPLCDLWLGWGAGGSYQERDFEVICLLRRYWIERMRNFPKALGPMALGLTQKGNPLHPLYMPSSKDLKPFKLTL